jgi:hypothetical protein
MDSKWRSISAVVNYGSIIVSTTLSDDSIVSNGVYEMQVASQTEIAWMSTNKLVRKILKITSLFLKQVSSNLP